MYTYYVSCTRKSGFMYMNINRRFGGGILCFPEFYSNQQFLLVIIFYKYTYLSTYSVNFVS